MPFDLKNVGATYQRLMDNVFHGMIGRSVEVYVDDIVVMSNSFEQHIQDLQEVFQALRRYQIRLNSDKCAFGVEGGKFLGFILTHQGIKANPEKCKVITEMRRHTVGGNCNCEVSEGPIQYLYLFVSG